MLNPTFAFEVSVHSFPGYYRTAIVEKISAMCKNNFEVPIEQNNSFYLIIFCLIYVAYLSATIGYRIMFNHVAVCLYENSCNFQNVFIPKNARSRYWFDSDNILLNSH